ncbi:MAG: helix-turn-helix transcriptional regulator [Eubacteriales bacterium]
MKIYWTGTSKNLVGSKVREIRKSKGWTQKYVATKLQLQGIDCSDLTVLRMENGSRFIADYEVKSLAEVLGISISELFE